VAMGHTISPHARPPHRSGGTATGQVPFSPLWQPNRLLLRVRRRGVVTLQQPTACFASTVRIRRIKRIFRARPYPQA